jgi:hypothetical protein
MGEEQHLYELVWGEPVPGADSKRHPSPAKPEPLSPPAPPEQKPSLPAEGPAQREVRARLDAIEASLSELSQAVQSSGSTAMSQEMILISLEALESRMNRMEKGIIRSLEHLESIIMGSRLR